MEDVQVALLIATSIIIVLITSIWWATRAKKRQAENVKPVKIPSPQEDLRAARNRYYQQKEEQKQLSEQQPPETEPPETETEPPETETEPPEPSESTKSAKERERMYSFATLKNAWASKEQDNNTTPTTATNKVNSSSKSNNNHNTISTITDTADNVVERPIPKPRKRGSDDIQAQAADIMEAQEPNAEYVETPVEESSDAKVEVSGDRRSSMLIQPIRQKVLHYKYGLLPRAKVSGNGYDDLGHPIIQPIKSFDHLLSWLPGFDNFNVPCVPLRRRGNTNPDVKIIVCHDMMGGYVLDKYPQGVGTTEDYHFYHWHLIEAFMYFTHNFITIPPTTWTNAAHANGVLSMGTIITEWDEGAQICSHILSSATNVQMFVEQCVSLANYYQFDGWLVNIENNLQVNTCVYDIKTESYTQTVNLLRGSNLHTRTRMHTHTQSP